MMVILTDDVPGLGDIGETVKVRPGYARNFLIPRGLAVESEARNARVIAHRMSQIEAKKRRLKGAAEETAKQIRNLTLEFALRVGTGGKVFGSITAKDIASKLAEAGFSTIDRRRVHLGEPLKKTGTHFVKVHLHPEVQVQVKLSVNEIQASKDEEDQETQEARETMETQAEERDSAQEES